MKLSNVPQLKALLIIHQQDPNHLGSQHCSHTKFHSYDMQKRCIQSSNNQSFYYPHHRLQLDSRHHRFLPHYQQRRLFLRPVSPPAFQSSPPTSSLATSEGTETVLLGACNVIENNRTDRKEWEEQQGVLAQMELVSDSESEESEWSDDDSDALTELSESFEAQPGSRQRQPWLNSIHTIRSREKVVRVLRGEEALPRNRWGIDRILAILVHHGEGQTVQNFLSPVPPLCSLYNDDRI